MHRMLGTDAADAADVPNVEHLKLHRELLVHLSAAGSVSDSRLRALERLPEDEPQLFAFFPDFDLDRTRAAVRAAADPQDARHAAEGNLLVQFDEHLGAIDDPELREWVRTELRRRLCLHQLAITIADSVVVPTLPMSQRQRRMLEDTQSHEMAARGARIAAGTAEILGDAETARTMREAEAEHLAASAAADERLSRSLRRTGVERTYVRRELYTRAARRSRRPGGSITHRGTAPGTTRPQTTRTRGTAASGRRRSTTTPAHGAGSGRPQLRRRAQPYRTPPPETRTPPLPRPGRVRPTHDPRRRPAAHRQRRRPRTSVRRIARWTA